MALLGLTSFAILLALACVGYPLVIGIASATRGREHAFPSAALPHITLVISAHDEAEVIRKKLANCAQLNYPVERLDFLLVDDGSTDATVELARAAALPRLAIHSVSHRGKSAALNSIRSRLSSEIVAFTDANSRLAPDALLELVRPFADSRVGAVVGELRYTGESGTGEFLYWRLEQWIKRAEDRLGAVLVGNGSIMALRRTCVSRLECDVANDFQWPLETLALGFEVRYRPTACCYESAASRLPEEWARKVRIVSRGVRGAVKLRRRLGLALFARLLARKAMRWTAPLLVLPLGAFATARFGAHAGALLFALACAAAITAFIGWRWEAARRGPIAIAAYVVLIPLAGLVGVWRGLTNRSPAIWQSASSTRAVSAPLRRR